MRRDLRRTDGNYRQSIVEHEPLPLIGERPNCKKCGRQLTLRESLWSADCTKCTGKEKTVGLLTNKI